MSNKSFRNEDCIPDAESENMSKCNGSNLQEVRIYDYRDFPNLVTASLAPGNSLIALATSLGPSSIVDQRFSAILDEDQVPNSVNQRMSVLYQPTFIRRSSYGDLTSPSKLDQSVGGYFCSLLSNEKSLEDNCTLKHPESDYHINTYSYRQNRFVFLTFVSYKSHSKLIQFISIVIYNVLLRISAGSIEMAFI